MKKKEIDSKKVYFKSKIGIKKEYSSLFIDRNNLDNFDDFIAGFSNQGLLTVMALLVVAQGVYSTGILNTFVDNIMHLNRDLQ